MNIRVAPAPRPRSNPRATQQNRPPVPLPSPGPVALVSQGDGDTIRVRNSQGQVLTLRLACIDAPEIAQGPSGAEARQTLAQLLQGQSLEIRPQTTDRYGRTVAEVFANGQNLNLEMVRLGAAFAYRDYLKGCDASAYLAAEQQAAQTRQGVWRWGDTVQRPWDFRHNR